MALQDFEFYIGGIEDGILAALDAPMTAIGVQTLAPYSGDLEAADLKKALASFATSFPRVMVSYTDGVDSIDPGVSAVLGRSVHYRHDATFAVIVASNDARSETARRRGVAGSQVGAYGMIAKVREVLTGLMLSRSVSGVIYPLTHTPLKLLSVEYIMRLQDISAYAIIMETYFHWKSPNRQAGGTAVSQLILGVDESLKDADSQIPNLPGVKIYSR